MNIEQIFVEAKKDLTMIISEIETTNLEEKQTEIENYLTFLKKATLLRKSNVEDTWTAAPSLELSDKDISATQFIQNETDKKSGYAFEKKLKGGWLVGTEIFVPETIVRNLGLEEGDIVFPTPKDEYGKYFFELIKKNPNPISNHEIGMVSFGKVERKDGFLIVAETFNGPIRIGEITYDFLLKDDDILDNKLEEGDIVDIAYYKENITKTARVIWKYDSSSPEINNSSRTTAFHKDKKQIIDFEMQKPLLKDKTVLIVGCEFKKDDYKQVFDAYEGAIEWIDGNEDAQRIEAKVKKVDCIILITTHQRHRSSNLIVTLAKKWNKPFKDVKATGNKSILENAFQLLNVSNKV